MANAPPKLAEACLDEALALIDEAGLENLSLREVARRLNVSHQAPYKHFASRDHLLAAVTARAFAGFATALDERKRADDPVADLRAMGHAYLSFALAHPLQYRLMFGDTLPSADDHPGMLGEARHSFDLLRAALRRIRTHTGQPLTEDEIDADALFVWSSMHGLATVLQTSVLASLDLSPAVLAGMIERMLDGIDAALAA
jgi:AcrR family transcriptional regulator